jgi:tetratricopeptide (TPR) repeat protein
VLHIQVAAGPEIRQEAGWRDLIAGRVHAVSHLFGPLNIQCTLAGVSAWEPDRKLPLEVNRRALAGYHGGGDWIDAGIYGPGPAGGEPGLAVPFDSRVLIFEQPGASENQRAAALAHEIGHILGAWHAHAADSVMDLPPGGKLDDATASVLSLTRSVNFLQGPSSLTAEAVARLQKNWTAAQEQPADNPFYRFYSSRGMEELVEGLRVPAEGDFTKAGQFAPALAQAHLDLGKAELANRDYIEAVEELRRALTLDYGSGEAMGGLGAALIATGHSDEGLQLLVKSVKMNPGDSKAHATMGGALLRLPGRMDEGIAEIREAARIDPGNTVFERSLEQALAARQQGRQ